MTHLLRRHDLRRIHGAPGGELCLRYSGKSDIDWTARIDGYPPGTLAVVTRADVALPRSLEFCAEDAGVDLEAHPMVPRLRVLVAEALLYAHRSNALELIEQLSGIDIAWAPGAEQSVRDSERSALRSVDVAVRELAGDLGARGRRRRAHELVYPADDTVIPIGPTRPIRATTFSDDAIETMAQEIEEARRADMPQRLPPGVRRALYRLTPGIYLVEDGLLCPHPSLRAALEQAARTDSRSADRAVIDWDGEWPVMSRRFGSGGAPTYRIDRALQRFMASSESRAAAP